MAVISLIEREKKTSKGLLPIEWVVATYLVGTTIMMLVIYPKLHSPEYMLLTRSEVVVGTILSYGLFRLWPCRLTRFIRIGIQLVFLALWYPDTYELNRMSPNMDHIFAQLEQDCFGCQPALLFYQWADNPIFSELMDLGYAAYYPMIVVVVVYYFIWRYDEFDRASFIVATSFFIYYVIFIAVPVTGPQFYYKAVGLNDIAHGIFPNVNDWFNAHQDVMESPGYKDGFFYKIVADAHNAGERPTAAFPSSHVGIGTILMILAWTAYDTKGSRKGRRKAAKKKRMLFYILLPFYLLMCASTVYILAHYAIDVVAGWISAIVFYFILHYTYRYLLQGMAD